MKSSDGMSSPVLDFVDLGYPLHVFTRNILEVI